MFKQQQNNNIPNNIEVLFAPTPEGCSNNISMLFGMLFQPSTRRFILNLRIEPSCMECNPVLYMNPEPNHTTLTATKIPHALGTQWSNGCERKKQRDCIRKKHITKSF
jgi:hypothetical protein